MRGRIDLVDDADRVSKRGHDVWKNMNVAVRGIKTGPSSFQSAVPPNESRRFRRLPLRLEYRPARVKLMVAGLFTWRMPKRLRVDFIDVVALQCAFDGNLPIALKVVVCCDNLSPADGITSIAELISPLSPIFNSRPVLRTCCVDW